MRLGPQWPAPTTPISIIPANIAAGESPIPDGGIGERPEDRPPVEDRTHLRLAERAVGIDLGDGGFHESIAQLDGPEEQIRLQLVGVEPRPVEIEVRVTEQARTESPKAVRGVGDTATSETGEQLRVEPHRDPSISRHVAQVAPGIKEAGALYEVGPVIGDRLEQGRDLLGSVLVVAGGHDDGARAGGQDVLESSPESDADPLAAAQLDDGGAGGGGLVTRSVGGAVVHDDDLVDDRTGRTSHDLADLPRLVEHGNDEHH
jgi:hypothetical protein